MKKSGFILFFFCLSTLDASPLEFWLYQNRLQHLSLYDLAIQSEHTHLAFPLGRQLGRENSPQFVRVAFLKVAGMPVTYESCERAFDKTEVLLSHFPETAETYPGVMEQVMDLLFSCKQQEGRLREIWLSLKEHPALQEIFLEKALPVHADKIPLEWVDVKSLSQSGQAFLQRYNILNGHPHLSQDLDLSLEENCWFKKVYLGYNEQTCSQSSVVLGHQVCFFNQDCEKLFINYWLEQEDLQSIQEMVSKAAVIQPKNFSKIKKRIAVVEDFLHGRLVDLVHAIYQRASSIPNLKIYTDNEWLRYQVRLSKTSVSNTRHQIASVLLTAQNLHAILSVVPSLRQQYAPEISQFKEIQQRIGDLKRTLRSQEELKLSIKEFPYFTEQSLKTLLSRAEIKQAKIAAKEAG